MYCTLFTDEIDVVHAVFDKSGTFEEEATGEGIDVKPVLYKGFPLVHALKTDPDHFDKSGCEYLNMCNRWDICMAKFITTLNTTVAITQTNWFQCNWMILTLLENVINSISLLFESIF